MSPEVKYVAEDLYLQPSKLFSCEPIDRTDARYLNLYHHPIINTLQKILDISLYNDKFYSLTPSTVPPKFDYTNKNLVFHTHSGIIDNPLIHALYSDAGTTLTTLSQTLSKSVTVIYLPLSFCTLISNCMESFSLLKMFQIILFEVIGI